MRGYSIACSAFLFSAAVFGQVPQSHFLAPAAGLTDLDSTNGRKCAANAGQLHCVRAAGTVIEHFWTRDGVVWKGPEVAATGGHGPAITVLPDGTVGLVYAIGNNVEYRWRGAKTNLWSAATIISPDFIPQEAAIVSYGASVYVAVADQLEVQYTSFPATAPPKVVDLQLVEDSLLCSYDVFAKPAIAVLPSGPTSTAPAILVAYFHLRGADVGCPKVSSFFEVAVTRADKFEQVCCKDYPLSAAPAGYSLSISQNSQTGEYFVGASVVLNTGSVTELFKDNIWNRGNVKSATILNAAASIDVAVENVECSPAIRIAVSESTTGKTWLRTGVWNGSSPAWDSGGPVILTASGRSPQAILWNTSIVSWSGRNLRWVTNLVDSVFLRSDPSSGNQIQWAGKTLPSWNEYPCRYTFVPSTF